MRRLIALCLIALGTINIADAQPCRGRVNYGTVANPNWSPWITWECPNDQTCEINSSSNPPTGGCARRG